MAKYPLIYGNNDTAFNLNTDNDGTPRNPSDSSFDIYIYKNDNDTITIAYAIITLKNIGSSGALNFSNIRLKDANGNYYDDSYSGFTINPADSNGDIYIGQQDGISGGSGNKTEDVGSDLMGAAGDSVASTAARWLKVTSTGDLQDSDDSSEGSTSLGVDSSYRIVPVYTIDALKTDGIPSNSWATFVLEFAPTVDGDGDATSLVIESNAAETVIPLFGEAFNEVVIGMKRGAISGSDFHVNSTIYNLGEVNLGYKGVITGTTSDPSYPVIKLFDTSVSSIADDFDWIQETYQSSATAWVVGNSTMSNPGNHSFKQLHPTYSYQGTGWTTDIDSLGGNNNNHNFDDTSNVALYKKFYFPAAVLSSGTLSNGNNAAWNYVEADFKLYQWSTVYWTLASTGASDSFTYVTTAGVYHRLTLPSSEWQSSSIYNENKRQLLYTKLTCANGSDVCEGGGDAKVDLITSLRWNNWANASSGADSGENTEFSANGFRLKGVDFEATSCNSYRTDVVGSFTNAATQTFTAFTNQGNTKDCDFYYEATPNITFKKRFNYTSGDKSCAADNTSDFGIIEGQLYPDASSLYWKGLTNYPHMADAGSNYYKLAYWPKRDVLTIYPKSAGGGNIFLKDASCPGYGSGGTGLPASESGGIVTEPVAQWYNAIGEPLTNVAGTFTTNNSSISHDDGESVTGVYSGDGGKIYSNNNSTYTNTGGSKTGFNSFVDVLGLETNFSAYNPNRIFHGGNAYKKHIRTKNGDTIPEFVNNDNIYDLGNAQLNATAGEYRAHGIFKLGNPGQNLIWIHSIHTEKAYMYEIDVSDPDNNVNGKANYGYMPNVDSTTGTPILGPKLEFFTQVGVLSNLNSSSHWREKKAYYTTNINGQLPTDSASKFDPEIGKYYVGVGSNKSHFIFPDFGAQDGAPVGATTNYSTLPIGTRYGSSWLMTYHLYGSNIRAGGGGDIYVRMSANSDSNQDDLGEYRMALKVTYMVHDWGNTKYRKEVNGVDTNVFHNADVASDAAENAYNTENQQALRLKEATFIFKMTVDDQAELEVTDQEGDVVSNESVTSNINFGRVNIG